MKADQNRVPPTQLYWVFKLGESLRNQMPLLTNECFSFIRNSWPSISIDASGVGVHGSEEAGTFRQSEDYFRRLIRRAAAHLAEEIYECADGADALKAYTAHQPDLVFMDIRMPRMNGLSATMQIKQV